MRPWVEDLAPARQALGHFEGINRVIRGTLDNGGRIYPHGNGNTAWIVEEFPLWRMVWPAYGGRISPGTYITRGTAGLSILGWRGSIPVPERSPDPLKRLTPAVASRHDSGRTPLLPRIRCLLEGMAGLEGRIRWQAADVVDVVPSVCRQLLGGRWLRGAAQKSNTAVSWKNLPCPPAWSVNGGG